jgi:hypothetical protein
MLENAKHQHRYIQAVLARNKQVLFFVQLHEVDLFVLSTTESWQMGNKFSVFFVLYNNRNTQVKIFVFLPRSKPRTSASLVAHTAEAGTLV